MNKHRPKVHRSLACDLFHTGTQHILCSSISNKRVADVYMKVQTLFRFEVNTVIFLQMNECFTPWKIRLGTKRYKLLQHTRRNII